ncbi:MAG: replicative DNA helicase [Planctomycetota bacterium]
MNDEPTSLSAEEVLARETERAQRPARGARGRRAPRGLDDTQRRDVAALFGAQPPVALEAEMGLLGAVLWDPKVVGDVLQIVRTGDDFSSPRHGRIYDSIVELYDRHASVDLVMLNQLLKDRGLVDAVGGVEYLVQLAEGVPSAANATHWARIVREKATLRELIAAAGEILSDAHTSREGAQDVLESAEQRIFRIAQKREQGSVSSANELVDETMRLLEQSEGKGFAGVRSGFVEFDEMTNGMQRGEMLILAARPSMGKTALALNMLEQVARIGTPALMFSLEMGRQQLIQRMLCALGQIDGQRMRRHMLGSDDYRRLMGACGDLSKLPIYIDDTPGLTLLAMRSKARRMKERFGIGFIAIDYLQLMTAGGKVESRQLEVSEISRGIKAMARELEVPVLCLSQLNRAAEQREGHRPRMSDLRESGSIEQDADVVMMLHREEYYHRNDPNWADENPDKVGTGELIVAKQRNGPTGTVNLVWDGNTTRFKSQAYAASPEEAMRDSAPRRVIAPTRPRAVEAPDDDLPM